MYKLPTRWIPGFVLAVVLILITNACRSIEEAVEMTEPEQVATATAVLPTAPPTELLPPATPRPTLDHSVTTPTTAPPTVTPSHTLTPLPVTQPFDQAETLGVLWQHSSWERGWPVYIGDVIVFHQHTPDRALVVVDIYTGRQVNAIPLPVENTVFAISNGTAYLASPDRTGRLIISAYHLSNGALLWTRPWLSAVPSAKLYADENGLLLVEPGRTSSQVTLTMLDTNGQEHWRKHYQCQYPSGALFASGYLEVQCHQKALLLSRDDGALLEQTTIHGYAHGVATEQLLFRLHRPLRGDQSARYYLAAIDVENQATLWSYPVSDSDTVWRFSIFGEDIIYKVGSQVTRLEGRTGEVVWQQTVRSETGRHILEVDDWLLVGSDNGFLHMLSAETGALVWEQDIWATVSSRPIYIWPERWAEDIILINALHSYLALSPYGDLSWTLPTPTPAAAVPLPTATAHPVLPTLVPGTVPTRPATIEQWPAAIVAFLNSQLTDVGQLQAVLEDWLSEGSGFGPYGTVDFIQVDLTGDGQFEHVIAIDGGGYLNEGWLLILQGGTARDYRLLWAEPTAMPCVMIVRDLNGDGLQNIVYSETFLGAHTASVALFPIGWRHDSLVDLSSGRIRTTNADLAEARIEDTTGDGRAEIIIRGGTFGSAGAGPSRTSTFTYGWSDDGYILLSEVPDLPQDYYFFLMDANQLLLQGSYSTAIEMFETSMFSDDAFYYGQIERQRAFAEFQLVLAYLLLGDESGAGRWASSGNYPDELYSQVKEIFWTQYQATKDWTMAAEAARTRVRLAGYERAQIIDWVGYANRPLDLNSICPCPDCLQGTIGSAYD
jgi:outer membrane protein assembly factor BamB